MYYSGGRKLNVTGSNLHAVKQPKMFAIYTLGGETRITEKEVSLLSRRVRDEKKGKKPICSPIVHELLLLLCAIFRTFSLLLCIICDYGTHITDTCNFEDIGNTMSDDNAEQ